MWGVVVVAVVVDEEEAVWYNGGNSHEAWGWAIPWFLVKFTDERELVTDGRTDGPTHPRVDASKNCSQYIWNNFLFTNPSYKLCPLLGLIERKTLLKPIFTFFQWCRSQWFCWRWEGKCWPGEWILHQPSISVQRRTMVRNFTNQTYSRWSQIISYFSITWLYSC